MKSALMQSLFHSLEVAVVCLVILGIMWLGSIIGIVDIAMVKDSVVPMLLVTLGSLAPKYARASESSPVPDYVNE